MGGLDERAVRNEIQKLRARIVELERELGETNDLKNSQEELREDEQYIGSCVDITEQKLIEDALRISQQRLELSQEVAGIGTWDWDIATGKTYCSRGYGPLYGLPPGDLAPPLEQWLELIYPEDRVRIREGLTQVVERTDHYSAEFRVVWRDGTIHWLYGRGQVFRDSRGNPIRVIGVNMDISERKRIEVTLYESEERFRAIFNQASVGMAQAGPDGKWLLLNDWFCKFLGYSQAELHGTTFLDVTHPEDQEATRTAVRQLLTGEISSWSTEKRYIRKDGSVVWGRLFTSLVRGRDNHPQCFLSVVEDITQKLQAERALRDSERRFILAQQAARLAVWDRDLRTNVIAISGEYTKIYGLAADYPELPYEEWLEMVHPEDRERVRRHNRETIAGTRTWDDEFRIVWPDGSVRWVLGKGTVFRDAAGRPVRIAGVNLDITERKEAEEALRRSELVHKQVLDIIPSCIFVLDVTSDGRFKFVSVNPAEEKALGLSSIEVSGKFIEQVLAEEVAKQVTEHYRSCLEAGTDISYEDELNLPGGRRYFRTTLTGVRNSAGHIHRIVGCCIDLTEVKRSQEEALARQKLESLGVLARGIAHDFNNVLSGILAQAELMEEDLPADSSCNGELQRIKTVAIRGAEIVRQLMIYAGHEQASLVEPIDLSEIAKEILELLKVSISKHVVLRTDLRDDLPAVLGNASQIRQVLMNLIINASEAIGDKQGAISVTTAHVTGGRDLAPDDATDLPPGDYVRMEVLDTGSGITEEAKSKIFDPFYSTKFAGRGLGLSAVQGIVRNHGGGIQLMSAPGQGTTFQVFLHCAPKGASEIQSPINSSEPEQSKVRAGTILVVEDEETLRRAVSRALRNRDFSVIEANDGSVAMDLIRGYKDEIDAVLLDVTLPGVSSREVFEEALRMRPDVKVIVTSAYGKETVDASFAGLRIEQFIRKPFHLGDLAHLLVSALSGQASAARMT